MKLDGPLFVSMFMFLWQKLMEVALVACKILDRRNSSAWEHKITLKVSRRLLKKGKSTACSFRLPGMN